MTREEYYVESLESACDEHGVTLTREQARLIARDMMVSVENIGMAFGDHCIPNPAIEEQKRMRQKHESEMKERDEEIAAWRSEACRLAKIDESEAWYDIHDKCVWSLRR